jgi:oxalate decarboxylase/phosphoglucose isomerase-like protein (cupin superfamily)
MAMEVKTEDRKKKMENRRPDIRYLNDMKSVLYDQKWTKAILNFPVYYMYRGIKKQGKLRYDITKLTSRMLGQEFPKTFGHNHLGQCQEIYEVLSSKALFLFQKCQGKIVKEVFAIRAKRGDFIIIPPNYDHLIINSSKKNLKTGNWISQKCTHVYDFIKKMGGACYYYTKSGWIKNKNYDIIPKLRFKKSLKLMPKNLDFLK